MKKILTLVLPLIFTITSFAITGPRVEVGGNIELNNLRDFQTNQQFTITGYIAPMWQYKFNSNNEINFGPKAYLGYIGNFKKDNKMKVEVLGALEYGYRINNVVKYIGGLELGLDSYISIKKGSKDLTLDITGTEGLGIYVLNGIRLYDKINLSLRAGYSTVYDFSVGLNIGYKF